MSKVIDALKREPSPKLAQQTPKGIIQEVQVESHGRELTQESLADICFSAVGKPKTAEPPVIIKVTEKNRAASAIPWVITSVAFLITAVALFSTKRLLIDVRVIDDKTLVRSYDDEALPLSSPPASSVEESVATDTTQNIPLDQLVFEGAAILQSSKDSRRLTLVNSSVSPFARAVYHPQRPLDLSKSKMVFEVRGGKGGEKLAIAIKDRGNLQAFKKGFFIPTPEGLSTEWQTSEVSLVDLNENFDLKNIVSLRFEFGTKDTSNRSGDTIYVRNLRIVPLG